MVASARLPRAAIIRLGLTSQPAKTDSIPFYTTGCVLTLPSCPLVAVRCRDTIDYRVAITSITLSLSLPFIRIGSSDQ